MKSFAMVCAVAATAVTTFVGYGCISSSGGDKPAGSDGGGSSSGGSGSSGGSSGGSGSGGDDGGGVTFSCYSAVNFLCTEELAPASAMASEQQVCTNMGMGTLATGPCPTAGLVACCVKDPVTQCYYSEIVASIAQEACNDGTWTVYGDGGAGDDSGADGGTTNAQAWVGTWARSGPETVTCNGTATNYTLTGNVTIALGAGSDGITFKQPNGCVFDFTVSGSTATVMAGQMCVEALDAGVTNTITEASHTLTLSADGKTITSVDSNSEEKSNSSTVCTVTSNTTLTMP